MVKSRITPEILLFYWRGGVIPLWRQECTARLIELYPDAKIIADQSVESLENCVHISDCWRIYQCSLAPRALWVDNDIWLDAPLNLTERPAMADEYHTKHWSIIWSGDNPNVFIGRNVWDFKRNPDVDKLIITGTHWKANADGSKVRREYS